MEGIISLDSKHKVLGYLTHVLVLSQKRQVKDNSEGAGVGGHDDKLGGTTVEGLGALVGTLLQLTVVSGLLHKVEEALGEGLIGDGPRCASIFGHCCIVVGNSNTRS